MDFWRKRLVFKLLAVRSKNGLFAFWLPPCVEILDWDAAVGAVSENVDDDLGFSENDSRMSVAVRKLLVSGLRFQRLWFQPEKDCWDAKLSQFLSIYSRAVSMQELNFNYSSNNCQRVGEEKSIFSNSYRIDFVTKREFWFHDWVDPTHEDGCQKFVKFEFQMKRKWIFFEVFPEHGERCRWRVEMIGLSLNRKSN